MKLNGFDGKEVRITLKDGSVFEGACVLNSDEYNEIAFGIEEEGLEISDWLFAKSDIANVEIITQCNPYLAPFGTIEKTAVEDGLASILDILLSDEPRNAERMLACLEWYIKETPGLLPKKEPLEEALRETKKLYSSEIITKKCADLLTALNRPPL